jgi:hypothetical protein
MFRDIAQIGCGNQIGHSVWRPFLRPDEFNIHYVAMGEVNKAPEFSSMVVKEAACSQGALAVPIDFTCRWGGGSEGRDTVGFWFPNCPPDYVSLSDIVTRESRCNVNDVRKDGIDPNFRCVHKNLTVPIDLAGQAAWTSKCIGPSGNIYKMAARQQGYRAHFNDFRPDNEQFRISNVPSSLYSDLSEVLTLSNNSTSKQGMKFTLTRGLTSTLGEETTTSKEFRADFSLKSIIGLASPVSKSGAKGEASREMEAKFGFTFADSKKISQTDVSLISQSTEITIDVPACKTAKLAQRIFVTSQLGELESTATLFSANFGVVLEDISNCSSSNVTAPVVGTTPNNPTATAPMSPGNTKNSPGLCSALEEVQSNQNEARKVLEATSLAVADSNQILQSIQSNSEETKITA